MKMKLLPCPRFDEIEIRGNKQIEPQPTPPTI
ncbi:hypothetical protein CCACVL1_30552 [Corchorus capsularis]|uniref:Uncharacterized protein n=1 Tax=Corchorus capsularis TaxID=210143 RepID=A0A1R3FWL5_COCAP|nr:hypothetical protein CCACVL1_30552 [Corchorus capsularis]